MNIEEITSTRERLKILDEIVFLEDEFGVNETAKKAKISKGLVSKYFEILVKNKILSRIKTKFIINDNSFVKSLKILLNIQKIDLALIKKYSFIKSVGLYGSCAKGLNTINSDIDIWIKIEKVSDEKVAEFVSNAKKINFKLNILVLDDKKLNLLKKEDNLFYNSIYFGSIILYGKENEI